MSRTGSMAVIYVKSTMLVLSVALAALGMLLITGGLTTLTVSPVRPASPHPPPATPSGTATTPTTPVPTTPTAPPQTTPAPPTSPGGQPPQEQPSQQPPEQQPPQEQPPQEQPPAQPQGHRQALEGQSPARAVDRLNKPQSSPPPAAQQETVQANAPALMTAWVGLITNLAGMVTALITVNTEREKRRGDDR